ncbi:MAG: CotH kinase family protein [Myxococcota bacterium]
MKKVALLLLLGAGCLGVTAATAAAEPGVPVYRLQLTEKALGRLLDHQQRIRTLDFLTANDRLWVPATLLHDGEAYDVKLRLRGDLPAHWRGSKPSYRVKFKGRLLDGRKEIDLIVPWDKHYAVEWLQTRVARDLGLLAFPGRFVDVAINGRSQGLYYESEHPTRQYLERNGRVPSSIFTFGANWTFFFGQKYHHIVFQRVGSRSSPPFESAAQVKQRATWDPDTPELARRQLGYMLEFYELVTEGRADAVRRRAPDYLDLEKFARFVALQNFFGSNHGMALNDNTRLYLDPTSGKFEFIPWDTGLRSLDERARARKLPVAALLTPEDAVFRVLLTAIPGVREARDAALAGLVARGEAYRRALDDRHAELLRQYPDEERLRQQRERHDRVFRENVAQLAAVLGVAAASGPSQ